MLFVGDSRLQYLYRQEATLVDLPRAVIVSVPGLQLPELFPLLVTHLEREAAEPFDALVLLCIQCDLTRLERWDYTSHLKVMRCDFQTDIFSYIHRMADVYDRIKERFPSLHVIWTLPYVPDFIRHNLYRLGLPYDLTFEGCEVFRCWEKRFFWCLHRFTEVWALRFKHERMFILESLRDRVPCGTNTNKVSTVDGLHPDQRTAGRFWYQIYWYLKVTYQEPNVQFPIPPPFSDEEFEYEESTYFSPPPLPFSFGVSDRFTPVPRAVVDNDVPALVQAPVLCAPPPPLALVAPRVDPTLPLASGFGSASSIIIGPSSSSSAPSVRPKSCQSARSTSSLLPNTQVPLPSPTLSHVHTASPSPPRLKSEIYVPAPSRHVSFTTPPSRAERRARREKKLEDRYKEIRMCFRDSRRRQLRLMRQNLDLLMGTQNASHFCSDRMVLSSSSSSDSTD